MRRLSFPDGTLDVVLSMDTVSYRMTLHPSPLSIVHLLAPAPYGGLESVVQTLAAAQRDAGDAVGVAVVLNDEGSHPFVEALQARGLEVAVIRVRGRQYLAERRQVRSLLERRRADVLHTHGYRPDVVDAPVARTLRLPTVTTVHGFTGGGGLKGRLYEWLQLRAFRGFDAVLAVSEKLRGELIRKGVPERCVHTVRNAFASDPATLERVEARRALGISSDDKVVGWIGRMGPEKAPEVMVRVLAATKTPGLRLSYVGSGPMEPECREFAGSLGLADRIRWHGTVANAGRLIRAFDAVVLTSWTEGTPIVLLEAMAAGVPVVSTAVGGIPETVDAESAWLAPAGDVRSLAAAVDEVFAQPSVAAERVTEAKRRIEQERSVGSWMEQHREIYRAVVGRAADRQR